MDALVTRAAMSPAIREQQDEYPMIAEPGGLMIAGQFGSFIADFLKLWKGSIEPGDVFITNDPYSVAGAISHLNDWLIMKPIFFEKKLSKNLKRNPNTATDVGSWMGCKFWTHDRYRRLCAWQSSERRELDL